MGSLFSSDDDYEAPFVVLPPPLPQPILHQPLKENCVYYHSEHGLHYPWLEPMYGKLVKAEFNEKDRGWIDYEKLHSANPGEPLHSWWLEHCRAISHDVRNLAADHWEKFVGPNRIIIMRFTFHNGLMYQSDKHPNIFTHFYRLEEDYARGLVALQQTQQSSPLVQLVQFK